MDLKHISSKFIVSPQITVQDLAQIQAQGIRAIICNRPDGEGVDQPSFEEIEAAARALGIEARYVPVQSGMVKDADVAAFAAALEEVQRPVLAYCRTGTRSSVIWALGQAKAQDADAILAATSKAGYELDHLRPLLRSIAAA